MVLPKKTELLSINGRHQEILLAEEANNNLNMSMIPRNLYDEVKADESCIGSNCGCDHQGFRW